MRVPSKNYGPFLAFNDAWFVRHQAGLLWLLNAPLIGLWFRWVLRIHNDVPRCERVTAIYPTAIVYAERPVWMNGKWRLQRTLDARCHAKFAKRIYFAFRPLWWTLHFWDWLIADRWLPELSFGFLTLTAYPAAGANSPVDGLVSYANTDQTFANIRSGAGNSANNTSNVFDVVLTTSTTTNQFYTLSRGIMCFDTSSLGGTATVSAVMLSLWFVFGQNALGSPEAHISGATPASTSSLANSDYNQLGTTSFGNIAYASLGSGAYNDFTLNSSGISNVNQSGVSSYGLQLSWDINNSFTGSWPGNFQQSLLEFYAADQTGTSSDPKLVVTYTSGGGEPFPAGYGSGNQRFNALLRM